MFSSPRDPLQEYLRSLQSQPETPVARWKLVLQPRNRFAGIKAVLLELLMLRLILLRIAMPMLLMIFILVNTLGNEWEIVPMAISWLALAGLVLTCAARIRAALKMGPDVASQLAFNLRVLTGWFWAGVLVVGLMVTRLSPMHEQIVGWCWAVISSLVLSWHCITMLRPRIT